MTSFIDTGVTLDIQDIEMYLDATASLEEAETRAGQSRLQIKEFYVDIDVC